MEEIFKDCHLDSNYMISNMGKVYSKRSRRNLDPYKMKSGYLRVNLSSNGKLISCYVNSLVANVFICKRNTMTVVHKNGDKSDCSVGNLKWSRRKKGGWTKQDRGINPETGVYFHEKLSIDDVRHIRKLLNDGVYQQEIADKLNICQATVAHIKRGSLRSSVR